MQGEGLGRSKQGTVTVLALLFSLLLGYAPAAAASAEIDRGVVRLGKADAGKASVLLRSGGRLQSDEAKGDELLGPFRGGIVTSSLFQYPAPAPAADAHDGVGTPPARGYQARAPPAA